MTTAPGFVELYEAEHGRLLASLALASGDVDQAREATDEAFSRALARWDRVGGMASPAGWIYRVALNVLRRRARRATLERRILAHQQPLPAWPSLPERAMDLWSAVQTLPTRQRLAVVLRYVSDLPEAEVAKVMGVARGTVASSLATAHKRLALLLVDELVQEVPHV